MFHWEPREAGNHRQGWENNYSPPHVLHTYNHCPQNTNNHNSNNNLATSVLSSVQEVEGGLWILKRYLLDHKTHSNATKDSSTNGVITIWMTMLNLVRGHKSWDETKGPRFSCDRFDFLSFVRPLQTGSKSSFMRWRWNRGWKCVDINCPFKVHLTKYQAINMHYLPQLSRLRARHIHYSNETPSF